MQCLPLFVRWEDYVPTYLPEGLRNVYFVQVGAHCGKNTRGCAVGGDPLFDYATRCGWRGLALEPFAPVFTRLCRNYAPWPGVRPLRTAVSDFVGSATFVTGNKETNHLAKTWELQRPRPNVTVGVVRLADVWREVDAPSVDVLVVDVEGAEPKVLAGDALPHPQPILILFEHVHLSDDDQQQIDRSLTAQGYTQLAEFRYPAGSNLANYDRRLINRLYGKPRRRKRRVRESAPSAPTVVLGDGVLGGVR